MAQLVFSDTANGQGIIQEIEQMTGLGATGITGNSALLKDFTRRVNIWNGRIQTDVLLADGRWQYDDFNIGDMPIATTNLVANQQDYSVRTDDNNRQIWKVSRVDAKDSSGQWKRLKQIDQNEIASGFSAYKSTAGSPAEFDWNGISLLLLPTPSYNSVAGLKIIFQREQKPFATSGTDSMTPGFASAFHYLLALGPSYEYGRDNGKANTGTLRQELQGGREELKSFYSARNTQEKPGLRINQESNR